MSPPPTSTAPAPAPSGGWSPISSSPPAGAGICLAYDRDRQDWRSLRLDRMSDVRARGSTFTPRAAPDAAAFIRHSISASPYRYVARVRYFVPENVVAQHFSTT